MRFLPAENAKHFLTATSTEKTTAAAIAAIAETAAIAAIAEATAVPAAGNAADAAVVNIDFYFSERGDINAHEYNLPGSGTFRCGKVS